MVPVLTSRKYHKPVLDVCYNTVCGVSIPTVDLGGVTYVIPRYLALNLKLAPDSLTRIIRRTDLNTVAQTVTVARTDLRLKAAVVVVIPADRLVSLLSHVRVSQIGITYPPISRRKLINTFMDFHKKLREAVVL